MKIEPYDSLAGEYDGWFAGNRFAYESELRAVRLLLPREGAGVEIGVGTGRFAGELGIPLGVEPSKSMREIARARGIGVICGRAEDLPFGDSRFDYVLMVAVLCFFEDAERALREAHRVLKPAGSLVIAFIDRESPLGGTYEERKGGTAFYRNATFRSSEEVAGFLKRAGFRAMVFRQTIFRDPGSMKEPDPVREGHGEGCFVVVRTEK